MNKETKLDPAFKLANNNEDKDMISLVITGKGKTIEPPDDDKERNPSANRKGKIFIIGG